MSQSVNLIPQSEKEVQTKEHLIKMSTLVTVLIAVLVGLVSVGLFYRSVSIKSKIKTHAKNISLYRNDISALDYIEINARNLDAKYNVLTKIFSSRVYYSVLMNELDKRIPSGVIIESLSLEKEKTLNIAGEGSDYLAIAKFVNTLSDPDFENAGEGLKGLFTNVTLNSVSLDSQTNKVNYAIIIEFDSNLLTKK